MDIQINITEEEIKEIIEDAIKADIKRTVEQIMSDEWRLRGFDRLMDAITPKMLEEVSKLVKTEEKYIINKVAERIARGLRISDSDIITALLAMTRESEQE